MKKKVSRNVIKAMAIGISAFAVTSAESITAMASDAEDNNQLAEDVDLAAEKTDDTAAQEATGAVTDAKQSGDELISAIEQKDVNETVTDAKNAFDEEANSKDETGKKVNDADVAVNNAGVQIGVAIDAAGYTKDAVEEADVNADAVTEIADAADTAMQMVQSDIQASIDSIKNATTIEEAESAYKQAQDIVATAEKGLTAAEEAYKAAKIAYDETMKVANEQDEAYQAAVQAAKDELDAATANLENVKAKAKVLSDELAKAQVAYQTLVNEKQGAVDKANTDKANAEQALTNAQNDKVAADQAVTDTKAIMNANEAALKIIEQEQVIENGKKEDWAACDKLFDLIMKGYYVPEIIKPEESSKVTYAGKFVKYTDDNKNYYLITIAKEDGTVEELYYNYKLEEDGKKLIIFEKVPGTEVVEAEKPEQYVVSAGDNIAVALSMRDFDAKKEAGDIFEVDGTYYFKNGASDTTDKFVAAQNQVITNEQTTTSYEAGKQIDTVTGTVTTTTTEEKTLSSEDVFASEKEAKADAESKLSENDTNLVVDVTSTTTFGAEAVVNYVTKFVTEIDLTGVKVMKGELWNLFNNAAQNLAEDWMNDIVSGLENANYYVISSKSEGAAVKKTIDKASLFSDDEYTFTAGKITLEYAATSKVDINYSTWDSIVGLFNNNERKNAIIAEQFAKDGTEIVDFTSFNWNIKTADAKAITHTQATGVVTEAKTAAAASADAKTAAIDAANAQAAKDASKISSKVSNIVGGVVKATAKTTGTAMYKATSNTVAKTSDSKVTKTNTDTKYGYEATYDQVTVDVQDDVVLSETVYAADALTYQAAVPAVTADIYTNANYDKYVKTGDTSGIKLFEATDEAFNNFLNNAANSKTAYEQAVENQKAAAGAVSEKINDVAAKENAVKAAENALEAAKKQTNYSDLIQLAEKTSSDLVKAIAKVELLKAAVDNMKNSNIDQTVLAVFNAKLEAAEIEYSNAKKTLNNAKNQVTDAKQTLDNKVAALTPAPVIPQAPAPSVTPSVQSQATVAPVQTTQNQPTTTIQDAQVPQANDANQTAVDENTDTVVIEDTDVPLAGAVDEQDGEVVIEDGDVPLIGGFDEDDTSKKKTWWWWIVLVICGGTGCEAYRRNRKKAKLNK